MMDGNDLKQLPNQGPTLIRELGVLGVDNVLLAVGDFERALDFYGTKLGLALKFQVPAMGIAGFQLGSEEPGLFIRAGKVPEAPPIPSPRVWLEVADARKTATELRGRGLPLVAEPFEVTTGWTVECADPWGNVVGFTDYLKAPERGRGPSAGGQ
jgi:predicted enzyme related to lactoylglutathione lyase